LYKKLLHKKPTLADLSDFNPQMAQGLSKLLTFEGDVESTFCYSFETSVTKSDGTIVTAELKPDGSNIPVTNANRKEYVDAYVEWVFNSSVRDQFDPFCSGFHLVCDGYALRMCRPEELEQLVCGSRILNFDELKEETEYVGFTDSSPQIRWFWQIVLAMNEEEKKKLLSFVTGSDRAPIEGLRSLPFRIQRNGPDSDRLPTSHTCFSVLMLPEYSSKEKLKRHLVTAIQNSQGFGLM
jgi:ubiquitin-protein ligase E3 A